MFSCSCGKTVLSWVDTSLEKSCPSCGTPVRFLETSRQISLEAYAKAKDSINQNCSIILETIKKLGSCNNRMIAETLNWSINRVTPRVKELRDSEHVVLDKVDKDIKTNTNTMFWKADPLTP